MDNQQQQSKADAPTKLTNWKNEPSLQALKGDLEAAKPFHDAQQIKINNWVDQMAVTGKAKPPKVVGRSQVQPKLIRRQAEWRYSALSEPFLNSQKLFSINPVTAEDDKAARQNELVLNWQFRTKLDKVKLIDDYVRSVVDEGICFIQTGWKRQSKTVKRTVPTYAFYELETPEQAEALQQAVDLQASDPRAYTENVPPELQAAVDYFNETDVATFAVQEGTTTVDEEVLLRNTPEISILNPANVYADPSCNGDYTKALFWVISFETNKAELLKDKRYKNLDKVNWEGASPMNEPDHETRTPQDFQFKDALRKKVVAYAYWGYYDIHGNDQLVPIVATWIADTMVRMEISPFEDEKLPIIAVPYLPVKREMYGEPDAELLEDNQKILGAVTRGMIDLMGRSANGQQGFAKGMLDPLNRRRYEMGQDYEFNPNLTPAAGLIEHKFPEIPVTAFNMLNLQNQEAEALSGVKSFSGGLSGDAYGKVATNTRGVLDAASKREMGILRRLAKGMSEVGIRVASMNAQFLSEKEVVRVTNDEFVPVMREDLKGNFDLIVDIATAEVDEAKSQDLGFMLQTLGPNMDQGIVMMLLSEIAELKRMPTLAKRLRDWQPQPDPMAEQVKQLEIEKLTLENAKLQSEVELNQAKASRERSLKDTEDLSFVEQEKGVKHAREMEKQGAQADANKELAVTKALLTPKKEGEARPNIEGAVGFNAISSTLPLQ